MKKKLLAALLAALLLLSGCQYSVVEDADEQQLLRGNAAIAETATPSPTAQPLQNGSRDGEGESAVSDLQKRLQALNYLDGKADGIFGEDTQAALEAFQALNGLPETGVLDAGTQAALGSAMAVPMPTPEPTPLAKGAKGDGVREVQEALRAYGFMTGSADGDFGKLTDEGLKLFQQYLYVVEGRGVLHHARADGRADGDACPFPHAGTFTDAAALAGRGRSGHRSDRDAAAHRHALCAGRRDVRRPDGRACKL